MNLKIAIRRLFNTLGCDISEIQKENYPDLYCKLYGVDAVEKRRFYNIGAGNFRHPAWTNVDHKSDWYKKSQGKSVGINWDLLSLTPIEVQSNSAEVVYSSHTVEHITDETALNMFKESHRILKKNGIFRLTMPDIDLHFRAYKEDDRHFFYWIDRYSQSKKYEKIKLNMSLHKASIQQIFLWSFASSASKLHTDGSPERINDNELDSIFREKQYEDALDHCTSKCSLDVQMKYPGNHINWWNKEKTFRMLRLAGFENIYLSGYGQSFCPVLRNTLLFDRTKPKISLYVEASK